jgi:hypothetical protein
MLRVRIQIFFLQQYRHLADIPTEKHDDLRLSPKPELVVANHDAPPNARCGFFTG